MAKLIVFNHVTLDGYFAGLNGDISWFRDDVRDAEFNEFAIENINLAGTLLFGRVTYELMASYWQTKDAVHNHPVVAERMNCLPKIVFSKTLDNVTWNNTKLFRDGILTSLQRMKEGPGKPITILGSGNIVSQLAQARLVDEYQLVVNPIAIGQGKTMFEGIRHTLPLRLIKTRAFRNGNVLLCYEPA